MRTRHLATAAFGSLLAAAVVWGAWASSAASATPAVPPQAYNIQTAQFGPPYYHRGYPFYW